MKKNTKLMIAFSSRALKIPEMNTTNYSSKKLKYLAVVWVVTITFSYYLMGEKCLVITDISTITFLRKKKGIISTGTTMSI